MDNPSHDLRYAFRSLRRSPGFTAVAVLTLALGIATTTAAFSILDSVVLRGLPYGAGDRLRTIYERSDDGKLRTPSYPTFSDWQAQSTSADAIAGFAFVRGDQVTLPGSDGEREIAAFVSPGFFTLMETRPALGRTFLPDEERAGAPHVAVLSYDLFVQRFGGDASILGKVVDIDSIPTTIVGVMPRAFAYPNFAGGGSWVPTQLWQPLAVFEAAHPAVLAQRGLHVDSRTLMGLRAGVDSARAASVMQTVQRRLAAEYPAEQGHWTSVELRSMGDELFGDLRPTLLLVSGAIALVLLLACANVANLFLVRASARSNELAVRLALGSGRWRLARRQLTEALLVAGAAGVLGTMLASALVGVVRHAIGAWLPLSRHLVMDGRAVAAAAVLSIGSAFLVGVAPALQAGGDRLMQRIRSASPAALGGARERRARNALVSAQFALALTLLIGAGLLIQSFRRLVAVPLGYDPTNVIEFAIDPGSREYEEPAQAAALYARVLDALRALPTVESAAAAGGALLPSSVEKPDAPANGQPLVRALYHPVSTDYLRTMRIGMESGRWFTEDDMRAAAGLVINQRLAHMLWPGANPIGERITVHRQSQARADFGQPITLPVIGVTADVRQGGPAQDPFPEVFLPYTLEVWPWMNFVVRAPEAEHMLRAVDAAVRRTDPGVRYIGEPSVMRGGAAGIGSRRRFITVVLGAFAAGALLLAAIGLYGIVAYGVAQRTREIGIRIALGASERRVVALVMRDGITFVAIGVVAGLAGALAAARLLRAMLFDTSATDPATLVVVTIVLTTASLAAIYAPARRAARTDPTIAIRAE